ncbi:MAG TPA: signal peptidase I, partial [Bacillota bacterium]
VYKLGYRFFTDPQPGDIVVFRYPLDPSRDFIKRVIAGPGDRIRIEEGRVYVNGEPLEEPYIRSRDSYNMPERQVPPGAVFVMGDNRTNSEDSREFGFVERDLIIGEAIVVYWPPQDSRLIH